MSVEEVEIDEPVEEEEIESDHEFSDPEDYFDDVDDEELLGDLIKQKPAVTSDNSTLIVVDNAPKVGPDRMEKLKTVLRKVLGRFGEILNEYYPTDSGGNFKGFFFIEYANAEQAQEAVRTCDGYKLDKSHIFTVNLVADFEKYDDPRDDWVTPEKTPFKEIGNLCYWLLEEDCNDQYAVVYNAGRPEKIAICYNTPVEPRIVCERERWTETYLRWSPKGSYLTTFHSQGVALWGTEKFERIGRFSHSNAQLVDFSPCERYLVTFSSYVDDPADPQNIIIWDIRTGKKKRTFSRTSSEEWPVIKWSFDGSYFAKKGTDYLSVYEVPSFGLLDKKSIVVKGIKDFQWSPSDHLIAYWLPELGEYPSKIIIMRIPNRQEIATKSRHLVSDCKLQWHKQGDYLCVRVDHWVNKSKKNQISCFEIFHTKVNETPIDSIEMKENVIDFSLEPNGNKLAIIHGEPPTRISVRFYKINDKGMPPTILKTFEKQPVNTLFWSPAGQFIVLAGLKSMDGLLEFVDTSDMSLMHKQEHTKVSDILWDPTGRYVVSSLSYWTEKSDTGYIVWSFQGKLLHRSPHYMEKFCQLLWRPRPPSLLTEEDIKTIKRDFKKYQYLFEQKDRNLKTKASKGLIDKRKKDWDDYKSLQERKKKQFQMKLAQFTDYMKILESKLAASKDIIEVTIKLKEKVEEINA